MRVCVCVRACVHVGVRVSLCVWLGAGVCIRYDAATDAFPVQEAVGKRLQALQGVLAHWRRGDVTSALRCACDAEDEMVVCGFLDSSSRHADIWTIDSVQLILPAVVRLLQSSSEDVVVIALQTCQMLVRLFGQVIQEVRAAPRPVGVDLASESRRSKIDSAYTGLQEAGASLAKLKRRAGRVGPLSRTLLASIEAIS